MLNVKRYSGSYWSVGSHCAVCMGLAANLLNVFSWSNSFYMKLPLPGICLSSDRNENFIVLSLCSLIISTDVLYLSERILRARIVFVLRQQ